ncbi:phosphate/phosphite/phosphonate ABC transporter substrate-binding protein [Candidatus Acetothermia bacterium]|nr:phosphate/phosphite/phosphonate ABC transporter substrate-binding protein [Candidatus Acetothermia bacterium]
MRSHRSRVVSLVGLLIVGIALGSLTVSLTAVSQGTLVPPKLTVVMVPSRPATVLQPSVEGLAKLLLAYIQANGFPQVQSVEAVVPASYPATIETLGTAKAHVGLLGPEQIVQVIDQYGSIPINVTVRNGSQRYRSQFMVNTSSPLSTMDDFVTAVKSGQTIKFSYGGSASSTSGFLFPCKTLKDNGILPANFNNFKTIHAANHQASAVAVYKGDVNVGVAFEGVETSLDSDNSKKELGWNPGDALPSTHIVKIGYSSWIPNDGIVVIKELDPGLAKVIKQGFVEILKTADGKKFGNDALNATGFVRAPDDYDMINALKAVRVVVNEITPKAADCDRQ